MVLRCLRHRQHVADDALALHAEIATSIGSCGPDDRYVDGHGLVAQPRLAIQLDPLHQRLLSPRIESSAALLGIDEGVQSHWSDQARALGSDLTQQHAEHALWEVVGLDLVSQGQSTQLGREVPVATDHPLQQACMRQMIEPSVATITLTGAVIERQVRGRAVFEKPLL